MKVLQEYFVIAIEKEIDKRINVGQKVHNEDLVHFLMADFRMSEIDARDYVDFYSSLFTEPVTE